MSGLAALFHRDGRPVDRAEVRALLEGAPYRGPDGMFVRTWQEVGLGHAKMTVTAEEKDEQQPLVSSRTGCSIVADVRLDNREELLARLPQRLPARSSDAALILSAYETWGLDAAAQLLGDYAFVIWDPKRQHLYCARDTNAQRTLYYRVDAHTFAAGSEIQQLFQDPAIRVEPNEEAIRNILTPLNLLRNEKDRAETFYADIYALPAAHWIVVSRESMRVQRYWELGTPSELRYKRKEEYAEHFRSLFFDVMRARLRTSQPLGAMLSGGLDSTTIVCSLQELYKDSPGAYSSFTSFSLAFDGLDCDERPLIEDVQRKYGFEAQYHSPEALQGWLRRDSWGFQSSPLHRISELHVLYGGAYKSGVRTLLTGEAADGIVRGYPLVFDSLLRKGQLREFWRHFQAYRHIAQERLRYTVAAHCLLPLLPLPLHKQISMSYTGRIMERDRNRMLPSWMPEGLRQDLVDRHIEFVFDMERGRRFSNTTQHLEYNYLYPPEIARAPSGWPLEISRPFSDRRLHEFLLAIPPEEKYSPHPDTPDTYAASKQLVRRSMEGILPDSIRLRTVPTHFGAVFHTELRRNWRVYEEIFGPSSRPEIAARGYVDQGKFWERLNLLRTDDKYGRDYIYVTRMAAFETWLRALKLPRPQRVTVPVLWRAHPWPVETRPDRAPISVGAPVAGLDQG